MGCMQQGKNEPTWCSFIITSFESLVSWSYSVEVPNNNLLNTSKGGKHTLHEHKFQCVGHFQAVTELMTNFTFNVDIISTIEQDKLNKPIEEKTKRLGLSVDTGSEWHDP